MSEKDYEDLDEATTEDLEDRGDFIEDELEDEDDEDQDESIDETEETDDDESDEVDIDLDEEEDEEDEPQKEPKIPKSRFDKVIRQREDAIERSLWLETQLEKLIDQANTRTKDVVQTPAKPAFDFEAAEEQYVSLIIEGETAKASKLRAQIDRERQEELKGLISEITAKATKEAKSESSAVLDEERFTSLIENYESKYKFLDADSDDYNEEAVDTVNTLLAGYVAAGKSKAEGLKLAVNKVAPLYTRTVETKRTLGDKRKAEAGRKAARAAKAQPSKTKSVSTRQVDSETVDVKKMSERDFSKLTAKEKSILRGDSL